MAMHLRARQLAQKRGDASLYHLIYEAAHSTRKYSSRHALLCLTISELVASLLAVAGRTGSTVWAARPC
jgi:hypothetical protein